MMRNMKGMLPACAASRAAATPAVQRSQRTRSGTAHPHEPGAGEPEWQRTMTTPDDLRCPGGRCAQDRCGEAMKRHGCCPARHLGRQCDRGGIWPPWRGLGSAPGRHRRRGNAPSPYNARLFRFRVRTPAEHLRKQLLPVFNGKEPAWSSSEWRAAARRTAPSTTSSSPIRACRATGASSSASASTTPRPSGTNRGFRIQLDRVAHWVSQGAQPSDAVKKLIKRGKAQLAAKPEAAAQ